MRAMVAMLAPADCATITRTGLVGYVCAGAAPICHTSPNRPSTMTVPLMFIFFFSIRKPCDCHLHALRRAARAASVHKFQGGAATFTLA